MDSPAPGPPPPALRLLGGNPAPPELLRSWATLDSLDAETRGEIIEHARACALGIAPADLPATLEGIAARQDRSAGEIGECLAMVQQVLARAAAVDLDRMSLQLDLRALAGAGAIDDVLDLFEETRDLLRSRLQEEAIARHGKLLTDVDWRLDTVHRSRGTENVDVQVLWLTLEYAEDGQRRTFSIQVTQPGLEKLRGLLGDLT